MLKIFDWIVRNWKIITLILTLLFLLTMIKPITSWLRTIKESLREIFTPLGFIVFIILIAFGVWIVYLYKSGLFEI